MGKFQSNSAVIGYECTCNEENNTEDKNARGKKMQQGPCPKDM